MENNLPIYIQIVNEIKRQIISGELKPGDKISSVRELAACFVVNPNTVQRALRELNLEGVFESKRGIGNFVSEDIRLIETLKEEKSQEITLDFIDKMRGIGYQDVDMLKELKHYFEEEKSKNE